MRTGTSSLISSLGSRVQRHLVCPTPPLAYQLGDQALPACVNGVCTLRCASGSAVFYSPLGQAYCPRRRQRQRAL